MRMERLALQGSGIRIFAGLRQLRQQRSKPLVSKFPDNVHACMGRAATLKPFLYHIYGGLIMKEKVVLAYSGGLDTTAIIPWLKENYDYEVICVCIDCGQGSELDGLDERAKACGASKLYIEDVIDEFCDEYIVPCVQGHAIYENKYLLGTSMARPVIAKRLVEIARKEGAVAICHGATGKGNDQIRFELGIKALAPDIKIIAPWRNDKWNMDSRESEIEYCRAHGIDLPFAADSSYSRDRNLWHISHEGLELEDPANEPNYEHLLVLGTTPEKLRMKANTSQ